jgi:hypothetical protein
VSEEFRNQAQEFANAVDLDNFVNLVAEIVVRVIYETINADEVKPDSSSEASSNQ